MSNCFRWSAERLSRGFSCWFWGQNWGLRSSGCEDSSDFCDNSLGANMGTAIVAALANARAVSIHAANVSAVGSHHGSRLCLNFGYRAVASFVHKTTHWSVLGFSIGTSVCFNPAQLLLMAREGLTRVAAATLNTPTVVYGLVLPQGALQFLAV